MPQLHTQSYALYVSAEVTEETNPHGSGDAFFTAEQEAHPVSPSWAEQ
jgi:hypothetical protein